ncbi:DNA-binding NarL/FixJ family response regulator [Saccharopolyspora lacisalsi]|uniref:DNA-binding NarL/FixJ family response regulator n=1 Tax=Halosaccharopolyspora lacisalsi TaxID=1000566 RepID=A0A839DY44_9PSEU|nr:response regulator transcription factor [Halosaccharopolyspora lacisalsi]MBA8824387.1 DNA-binding NarL/FixJ family response regulator [Halosaccharopolyspora lacisalsi]
MDVLRVLLVDDHRMLTEALSARLSATPDLWVVGCCVPGDPGLPETVGRLRPDILLIDTQSLGTTSGEVLERVVQARPSIRLVVLTAGYDAARAVDAARAGVTAWIPKEHGIEELIAVLRGVRRDYGWFPPQVLGAVLRELRNDVRQAREQSGPLDVLSDREREVLLGMVAGKRGGQIAEDLVISSQTVRTHTRSILTKLRVHSQLEAVSVACAAGLRGPREQLCATDGSTVTR